MSKLVVFKFVEGNAEQGFTIVLQIGGDGQRPMVETVGRLPAAPEIVDLYDNWQSSYRRAGLATARISAVTRQPTNISLLGDCQNSAQKLGELLNIWLCAPSFREIREALLENLRRHDAVRVILQTEDVYLRRLPWHLWEVLDRYPRAEIALSTPNYGRVKQITRPKSVVRILAILGSNTGIDVQADRDLLRRLPNAEVTFLVKPERKQLTDHLWQQGWDILFFAGHSASEANDSSGHIYINDTEQLTMHQLRYSLKRAVASGLKLAMFNSCDGLGLARELSDLHIPQVIVMRELVHDRVAQTFLKSFLDAFAHGESFYLSVRQAREQLQGLEDCFPCATWLPIICQNPAETPPTWAEWCDRGPNPATETGLDAPTPSRRSPHPSPKSPKQQPSKQTIEAGRRRRRQAKQQGIRDGVAGVTGGLYHFGTLSIQRLVVVLQWMLMGALGGSIAAAIGFYLLYWSPASWTVQRLLFQTLPGGKFALQPAIGLFMLAGLGILGGLEYTESWRNLHRVWLPKVTGIVGFGLGWLSWQLVQSEALEQGFGRVAAVAIGLLVLGLCLGEHPLLHALTAAIVAPLLLGLLLNTELWQPDGFITLMFWRSGDLLRLDWSLFWTSVRFFSVLGSITGISLGISYFLVLPSLRQVRRVF